MEHAMDERGKKKEKKGDRNDEELEDCESHEEDDDLESMGFEKDCAEEWKSVGEELEVRRRVAATAGEQRRG